MEGVRVKDLGFLTSALLGHEAVEPLRAWRLHEGGQERFLGSSRVKHNVVFILQCTKGASHASPSPERATLLSTLPQPGLGGQCSLLKGRLDVVRGND